MRKDYREVYQADKELVEQRLKKVFPPSLETSAQSYGIDAMKYSLNAGGKRIRPILLLETAKAFSVSQEESLVYATAVEMIHTYSLIHDDLPSMDNDDLRRGIPTNHKVFGEGFAILAGDSLLNYAYETMLDECVSNFREGKLKAMQYIANAAGIKGMIGGQVLDLRFENKECNSDILYAIHTHKTGALLKASVVAGAMLAGADEEEQKWLKIYAEKLGLAFQIVDDLLDVTGSADLMGKKTGMDTQKSTFPRLFGIERSKEMAEDITREAIDSLKNVDRDLWFLEELALEMTKRKW